MYDYHEHLFIVPRRCACFLVQHHLTLHYFQWNVSNTTHFSTERCVCFSFVSWTAVWSIKRFKNIKCLTLLSVYLKRWKNSPNSCRLLAKCVLEFEEKQVWKQDFKYTVDYCLKGCKSEEYTLFLWKPGSDTLVSHECVHGNWAALGLMVATLWIYQVILSIFHL